jgi:hypothetical protein
VAKLGHNANSLVITTGDRRNLRHPKQVLYRAEPRAVILANYLKSQSLAHVKHIQKWTTISAHLCSNMHCFAGGCRDKTWTVIESLNFIGRPTKTIVIKRRKVMGEHTGR